MAAVGVNPLAEVALARGDLPTARRYADETVALTAGVGQAIALVARARVAIAQDEPEQAERDAQDALAVAVAVDSPHNNAGCPGMPGRGGQRCG